MVQSAGGLMTMVGGLGLFGSVVFLNSLNYSSPPIPAGFLVGLLAIALGSGMGIGASVIAIREGTGRNLGKPERFMPWVMIALLSVGVCVYGVIEVINHPLELPECPCPANYYGSYPCLPCPSTSAGVCNGRGVCDDGAYGSGECYCELGWDGESCSECAPTFKGTLCDECKRGWTGDKCDRCYPGYTGSNCDRCDVGWVPETDLLGTLCRFCEPGHFGGYCTKCRNCTVHDRFAVCRDNDWHEANIYSPLSCTPQGTTCTDKYDCDSFNCKGSCVLGDTTTGDICEFDSDCTVGTCQFKQCCLEARHGNGHCDCGAVGYFGEYCEPCPGFDLVYSQTICNGHGSCTTEYAGDAYVGLRCACAGEMDGSVWSGDTCACKKASLDDENCTLCAGGAYGPTCEACPGGSGISQCNMHGKCSDGIVGDGTCSCDIDVTPGGLGAFKGEACEACLSDDFYGENCRTCPNLQVVQCIPGLNLTEIPGVGQCIQSCGAKTCNSIGRCV